MPVSLYQIKPVVTGLGDGGVDIGPMGGGGFDQRKIKEHKQRKSVEKRKSAEKRKRQFVRV